jgi:hypothetical protein
MDLLDAVVWPATPVRSIEEQAGLLRLSWDPDGLNLAICKAFNVAMSQPLRRRS